MTAAGKAEAGPEPGPQGLVAGNSEPAGQSKSTAVYEALRERILEGRYSPGTRLVIDQIAREAGVSAAPVREAVRRLEAEGLVSFERHVGARVTGIDVHAYGQAIEALAYLEGIATALAAPVLSGRDIADARSINDRMRAALRTFDPLEFTRLNQEFHECICMRCPNERLKRLLQREWEMIAMVRRSTFSFIPGRAAESVDEHERILHSISTGQMEIEVEVAAREHKLATLRSYAAYRERVEHM